MADWALLVAQVLAFAAADMAPITGLAVLLMLLASQGGGNAPARVEVHALKFEGVAQIDEGQLRGILVTRASDWLPWAERRYFDAAVFAADLRRIVAFYRDRGFPRARVLEHKTQLNGDGSGVSLTIRIDEGAPVVVAGIELRSFDVLADHEADLRDDLPVAVGRPVDVTVLNAARKVAFDELTDHGYPSPAVEIERRDLDAIRQLVVLTATPGTLSYYGPIEIAGLKTVDEAVIRGRLDYRPGDLFRASDLLAAQRRLFALGLFDFVNVAPSPDRPGETGVPTTVTVTEGKRQRLTFGVGYGSEELARAQIDWRYLNFLGHARTLGVLARWSSLNRGIRPRVEHPQLFGSPFSGEVAGEWWHEDEPAYLLDSYGGTVTLTGEFQRGHAHRRDKSQSLWRVTPAYLNAYTNYVVSDEALADPSLRDELIALGLNPDTGAGKGLLSSLMLDVERVAIDDPIDVRSGYRFKVHLGTAGRSLQGDFNYVEVGVEGHRYFTIANRAVLATRLRASVLDAPAPTDQNVPLFKRYFLGGASSLRGWGRYEVGPTDESGLTLGGLTLLESSAELRFPIWRRLGGVGFLDAGNAWPVPWTMQADDIRADAGAGLRYLTPVGPARFDIAWQLTPIPGLQINGEPEARHWRVHVSVGQAF
jgi:outer membrane protein assembly complex protein YaeT